MCIRDRASPARDGRVSRPRRRRRSERSRSRKNCWTARSLSPTPCGQYVHGIKQKLSEKQKKRLLSSTSIHEVHTLLKTAFSYAVEWDLIHKIPLPRDAPKVNIRERTIWDEKTMLAALQTIENPALHLAVHMSMRCV